MPTVTIFPIYICRINTDEYNMADHSFWSTEEAAKAASKGVSWYGADGTVVKGLAVCVDGSHYLISKKIDLDEREAMRLLQLQASARAKLTPEERAAVGLD